MQVNESSAGSFYEQYLELARQRSQETAAGGAPAAAKGFENVITRMGANAPPPIGIDRGSDDASGAGQGGGVRAGLPPPRPPAAKADAADSDSSADLLGLLGAGGGPSDVAPTESGGGFYAEALRSLENGADGGGSASDFARYMRGLLRNAYGA